MTHVDSDALVLRHVRQGDTSRVVTLLVRDGGKIAVLAKGSRRPGSRFGAGLDLFCLTRVRYRVRPNRDLLFLDDCELKRNFDDLSRDVMGYAAAGTCAELVDRSVPAGAASAEIFDLLLETFTVLAETAPLPEGEGPRAAALSVVFQLRLMDVLGIAPELTGCVSCGAADLAGSCSLSPRRGGLLCRRCRASEGGRRIDPATVELLRAGLFGEISGVMTAPRPPTRAAILESRGALDALLEYHHHGRPSGFRSRHFLDDLWKQRS